MARPATMDREAAFESAVELFWQRGYHSTSLQHLLDAMKIGKGSFYAAFESKEALFISALDYYLEVTQALFKSIRSEHQGLRAIETFLTTTVVDLSDEERQKGCLAVNSVLELAAVDGPLHDQASQVLDIIEAQFRSLLNEAQSAEEIRTDQSPKELAQLLFTMIQGLRVSMRRGLSRAQARKAIKGLIQLLSKEATP